MLKPKLVKKLIFLLNAVYGCVLIYLLKKKRRVEKSNR